MSNMKRPYTSKQMGDAGEMLVAAEITFAGIPAMKVPDCWPGYDVIAQRQGGGAPQRISVKTRTDGFAEYDERDVFDWLAIVPKQKQRRVFIIPRALADQQAKLHKPGSPLSHERYFALKDIPKKFAQYEDNFGLSTFK